MSNTKLYLHTVNRREMQIKTLRKLSWSYPKSKQDTPVLKCLSWPLKASETILNFNYLKEDPMLSTPVCHAEVACYEE